MDQIFTIIAIIIAFIAASTIFYILHKNWRIFSDFLREKKSLEAKISFSAKETDQKTLKKSGNDTFSSGDAPLKSVVHTAAKNAKNRKEKRNHLNQYDKLIFKKDFQTAATQLIAAIALDHHDTASHLLLAKHFLTHDIHPKKAEAAARDALDLEPQNLKALTRLAKSLALQKKHFDAIKFLEIAINIDKKHPQNMINLGTAYAVVEEWDNSIQTIKKALHFQPRNLDWLAILLATQIEGQKWAEAYETIQKLDHLDPFNTEWKDKMAEIKKNIK